ncbi:transmembrane protein 145-like isoform X3 [Tubulanus polymorphus]|uniref:transmembrane protein 145-like isoform X3 n=1 Tax=Tubulanus polymorphus TaxID=672921 RepID=UPI003DA437EB
MRVLTVISLLFCGCFIGITNSKYVSGHLKSAENWVFLTRFCFLSEIGKIRFKLSYPQTYEVQNILMYFDSPGQWEAVYKNDSKSCWQKYTTLGEYDLDVTDQIYRLDKFNFRGCNLYNTTTDQLIPSEVDTLLTSTGAEVKCEFRRSLTSNRARWWYVVLENCRSLKGLNLKYEIWMTNGEPGDLFFEHFSADEFYILQVDMAFLFAHLFLLGLSLYFSYVLADRQLFHTTYKMYLAALSCEVFSLIIMCCAYGVYAQSGVENRAAKYIGRVFESGGVLTFELMLILLAKGYTVTRGRLSQSGTIKVTVFMTAYIIIYVVLFIYEAFFFDPGLVLYTYESVPGYGLIVLRILAWIWFTVSVFFTLKHYQEKGKFYFPFYIFYTIWFWAGPIIILVAMTQMKPWVREKVVNGVENCVIFCGYLFFIILTRPSAANNNFPFHVRTAQIAIVNDQALADFPSNPYSDAPSRPNFTDLFVVSDNGGNPIPQRRPEEDSGGSMCYRTLLEVDDD